jgi:hypothetical protein
MKTLQVPLFLCAAFLLACFNCTSEGVSDDWFGISGITKDAKDSLVLKGVAVKLTNFMGNLEKPIPDVNTISDSTGYFNIQADPGTHIIKAPWGTKTYQADSCRVIFSKSGYRNDSMVLKGDLAWDTAAGLEPTPLVIYLHQSQ